MRLAMVNRLSANSQRGAAVIMTAGFMLLAILFLALAVDSGRLYLDKRSLQRIADVSALETAARNGCEPDADGNVLAQQFALESAVRNGFTPSDNRTLLARCGNVNIIDGRYSPATFVEGAGDFVQVEVTHSVPASLIAGGIFTDRINLFAAAAASKGGGRLAALTMRSSLGSVVSTEDSLLLNTVVGGLLGGSVNVSALSWNGLLNTDIQLLGFLDALAIELGLSAGSYESVLQTDMTIGQLLDASIDALSQGSGSGSTADINAAIIGLTALRAAVPAGAPLIRLGDILEVQTGTDAAGLAADMNLLGLIQGAVQLSNGESAVAADLPVSLPGVIGGRIRFKVMEPPQLSAIGNPELAKLDPLGPNRIFVRTSQIRTLVSVDLPISGSVLSNLESLLNNTFISDLTTAVNNVLSLNLVALAESVTCAVLGCKIERDVVDLKVLPTPRVDLNIDSGGGRAYVTDFDCSDGKSLTVPAQSATASVRMGHLGDSADDAASKVFASNAEPTVSPVPLLDIGSKRAKHECLPLSLGILCTKTWKKGSGWVDDRNDADRIAYAGGGIGLAINATPENNAGLAGTSTVLTYLAPPETDLPEVNYRDSETGDLSPAWQKIMSTGVVNSIANLLSAPTLHIFEPAGGGLGSGLGNVLTLVGSAANTLVSELQSIISGVLSPLLDPLLNELLKSLGLNLNEVEVGANLSCQSNDGARLIY